MKRVLFVSQAISQSYIDLLSEALGSEVLIDLISGSNVRVNGRLFTSPAHMSTSIKSRFICWYKHFLFTQKWMKSNRKNRYDLIFATSNPPINSYLGLSLKKTFKCPFVYMNWDLYPQIVSASINNPVADFFVKLWHSWNNKHYKDIDRMITIGHTMSDSINKELKEKIHINVIPIDVNVDVLKPVEKNINPFVLENNLLSKFIVLYSGKMGIGHNIECILQASELLRDISDIHFVFIGDGEKYNTVKRYIKDNDVCNISLFPLQPLSVFPYSMACGDIGIVSQEAYMSHLFMPSKAYSMMACGLSLIGISSGYDDLSALIKNNHIGYVVEDSSPVTLAEYIKDLYLHKEKLCNMKLRARNIAESDYSAEVVKKFYVNLFGELLHN